MCCEGIDVFWVQCLFKRGWKLGGLVVNKEVEVHGGDREEKAGNPAPCLNLNTSADIVCLMKASLVCHLCICSIVIQKCVICWFSIVF